METHTRTHTDHPCIRNAKLSVDARMLCAQFQLMNRITTATHVFKLSENYIAHTHGLVGGGGDGGNCSFRIFCFFVSISHCFSLWRHILMRTAARHHIIIIDVGVRITLPYGRYRCILHALYMPPLPTIQLVCIPSPCNVMLDDQRQRCSHLHIERRNASRAPSISLLHCGRNVFGVLLLSPKHAMSVDAAVIRAATGDHIARVSRPAPAHRK